MALWHESGGSLHQRNSAGCVNGGARTVLLKRKKISLLALRCDLWPRDSCGWSDWRPLALWIGKSKDGGTECPPHRDARFYRREACNTHDQEDATFASTTGPVVPQGDFHSPACRRRHWICRGRVEIGDTRQVRSFEHGLFEQTVREPEMKS